MCHHAKFIWYWGLNAGLHAYQARTVPNEIHLQPPNLLCFLVIDVKLRPLLLRHLFCQGCVVLINHQLTHSCD